MQIFIIFIHEWLQHSLAITKIFVLYPVFSLLKCILLAQQKMLKKVCDKRVSLFLTQTYSKTEDHELLGLDVVSLHLIAIYGFVLVGFSFAP